MDSRLLSSGLVLVASTQSHKHMVIPSTYQFPSLRDMQSGLILVQSLPSQSTFKHVKELPLCGYSHCSAGKLGIMCGFLFLLSQYVHLFLITSSLD